MIIGEAGNAKPKVMTNGRFWCMLWILMLLAARAGAQSDSPHISLRDSVDGAFDLSDYVIDAHGFVPVPYIITEPALGNFGGGIIPVFIRRRPPYVDTIKAQVVQTPVPPDITGGLFLYTLNNSWIAAAFRSGTFVKSRIKYIAGGGYANLNLEFYHTYTGGETRGYLFNLKTVPVLLQAMRRIGYSRWYAGLKYLFLYTSIANAGDAPPFVTKSEASSLVSELGAIVEYDSRDNIFTPDDGILAHFDAMRSDNIFGSDYDFWHLNYYMFVYKELLPRWVGYWRIAGQQSFGDQPFYLKPYINMRGIPIAKYQGNATVLTELESRWDFYRRWSLMLFGGTGKAFDEWSDFGISSWRYSYGTGFRYLLARKFKLRVGIDLAHSPGTFAYYIVFGTNS